MTSSKLIRLPPDTLRRYKEEAWRRKKSLNALFLEAMEKLLKEPVKS